MQSHLQWGSIEIRKDTLPFTKKALIIVSMLATSVFIFPHLAVAQAVQNEPMLFEVENIAPVSIVSNALPISDYAEGVIPKDDPRVIKLREFLASKNSPMAEYADYLLGKYHYRLIIGISFAESNFCKVQIRENNCWGIGGSRPESYPSLPDAFDRADGLIARYHELGMTTPETMRSTWVGWENSSWIVAVNQITSQLEELGL